MNKYKKSINLVNQIQKIRSNNNTSWMAILKVSLEKKIQNQPQKFYPKIYKDDKKISNIAKKILKINK